MKPKRLITHGCSFTYGEELSDPSASSWPSLLADRLSLNLSNLAKPGYNNDGIIEDILELDLGMDDLVIVSWTSYIRIMFKDDNGWFTLMPNNRMNDVFPNRLNLIKHFMEAANDFWLYKRWINQILLLQNYLESQHVKWLFLSAFDNQSQYTKYNKNMRAMMSKVATSNFVDWPSGGITEWVYPSPLGPKGHPLEEGHAKVAAKLLDALAIRYDIR